MSCIRATMTACVPPLARSPTHGSISPVRNHGAHRRRGKAHIGDIACAQGSRSAGLPRPRRITRFMGGAEAPETVQHGPSVAAFSAWHNRASRAVVQAHCPLHDTCAPTRFRVSQTGFHIRPGLQPAGQRLQSCARPISPPSAVTAALLDMFWLERATGQPRGRSAARHSPASQNRLARPFEPQARKS